MERLTVPAERLPDGRNRIHIIDARKVKEKAMDIYWRLKKYEDTGLSPDDVVDLMGNHAMAIGELATTPKWIPVTERLPDSFGTFLVAIDEVHGENRISVDAADFDPFEKRWSTFGYFCAGYKVTHWMPLPKPPKGK